MKRNRHRKPKTNSKDKNKQTATATIKNKQTGTFLVVQWLRIRLPRQGTWVQALVLEDPTCCGATKPVG